MAKTPSLRDFIESFQIDLFYENELINKYCEEFFTYPPRTPLNESDLIRFQNCVRDLIEDVYEKAKKNHYFKYQISYKRGWDNLFLFNALVDDVPFPYAYHDADDEFQALVRHFTKIHFFSYFGEWVKEYYAND